MVVHAYYPLGETRVEREARALVDHGYEVDILCLRDAGEAAFEGEAGINIYRLPVQRHKKRGLAVQLLEYLAFFVLVLAKLATLHFRRRYGVVQVHNLPDFLVFAALVPKVAGARLILDLHDLMPEFYAARFNSDLNNWMVRVVIWQEQLSCRFADHVITVSEHWRQTLIERGVAADKCSVVMNVADDRIFYEVEDDSGRPHQDSALRLIYHGTIVQRYGLDLALQAMAQLRAEFPDVHLTILGKGDFVDELLQMKQSLQLNGQVTIYDELRPAEELPGIIRAADVGIVPYRNDPFTDGLLPTKLMEYAALGIPAIAARTTAIESYFGDTMVALFEPGDATDLARCIRELAHCPQRVEALAQGTKQFNERYNWTRLGAAYVTLVERLGGR